MTWHLYIPFDDFLCGVHTHREETNRFKNETVSGISGTLDQHSSLRFSVFEKFLFWSTILNFFVQIMINFLVNFNLLFQFEPLFFDWKNILKIPKHCSWSVDSMRYHFYGNQITNEEDNNILLQVFQFIFGWPHLCRNTFEIFENCRNTFFSKNGDFSKFSRCIYIQHPKNQFLLHLH